MLLALLSLDCESWFLCSLTLQQWILAVIAEPDTSFENCSCVSWACPAAHRQDSAGKHHGENYSSLFPSNYIHFLTLHCLRFNSYWSHFCLVLLSFRSNSFQAKQSSSVQEQVPKRFAETNTEIVLLSPEVPSDPCLRSRTLKTAAEELLLTGKK